MDLIAFSLFLGLSEGHGTEPSSVCRMDRGPQSVFAPSACARATLHALRPRERHSEMGGALFFGA